MATNKQLSLDCATRIINTKLMQNLIPEGTPIYGEIEKMAEAFSKWLGDDPPQSRGGYPPKVEKPTYSEKCPSCGSETFDLRPTRKNPNGPIARCKNAGRWNNETKQFSNCQGAIWEQKGHVDADNNYSS